jgi:HK97 family phage prohead protease
MPYSKPSEAPSYIPDDKKKQWIEVWNSVYDKAKKDGKSDNDAEAEAFKQANGVIKKEKSGMSGKREFRFTKTGEFRMSEDDKSLIGYAAVWDQWADINNIIGSFRECLRRGCFRRAIQEKQDVRALFNHEPSALLGRCEAGTLRLAEDGQGLAFEVDLPDTQLGRDIRTLVQRRDLTGCSFGFTANDQTWSETVMDDGSVQYSRELMDVDLYDVGPVTYPAYTGTSVDARSLWPDGVPEEIATRGKKIIDPNEEISGAEEKELRREAVRLRFGIR